MNEMVNKIAQDTTEEKFDAMFNDVEKALLSLVQTTHNTINEKLEEMNETLRGSVAENINKLQDIIKGLNAEVQENKEKLAKNEKEINDVDFNAKKLNEEAKEKMEVNRCIQEMVAWVSEQLTAEAMTQNLNVIAGKFNEVSQKVAENLSQIPKNDNTLNKSSTLDLPSS